MALNINKLRNKAIDGVTKTLNKAKAADKPDPNKALNKALAGCGIKTPTRKFLISLVAELADDPKKVTPYKLLFDLDLEHTYKVKMVSYMHQLIDEESVNA